MSRLATGLPGRVVIVFIDKHFKALKITGGRVNLYITYPLFPSASQQAYPFISRHIDVTILILQKLRKYYLEKSLLTRLLQKLFNFRFWQACHLSYGDNINAFFK